MSINCTISVTTPVPIWCDVRGPSDPDTNGVRDKGCESCHDRAFSMSHLCTIYLRSIYVLLRVMWTNVCLGNLQWLLNPFSHLRHCSDFDFCRTSDEIPEVSHLWLVFGLLVSFGITSVRHVDTTFRYPSPTIKILPFLTNRDSCNFLPPKNLVLNPWILGLCPVFNPYVLTPVYSVSSFKFTF